MEKPNNSKSYKVHSLERGLDLIELMSHFSREMSLSELSREAGFNPSTTHRILDALKSRGYVRQNQSTSGYSLTYKLFEIASKAGWEKMLRDESSEIVAKLAEETRESAYFIIKDGLDALCLERIDRNPHIRILSLEKGGRMPLHMGGGPKAILAYLPESVIDRIIKFKGLEAWTPNTITNPLMLKKDLKEIREQGYALSLQDVTMGVNAIGCPVKNKEGKVIAALSVAGPASNLTQERIPDFIKLVKSSAQDLEERMRL